MYCQWFLVIPGESNSLALGNSARLGEQDWYVEAEIGDVSEIH
jgi:hypothetical protein